MQLVASRVAGRQCLPTQQRPSCQPIAVKPASARKVAVQAAAEETVSTNGAVTYSTNVVDFNELSDIIRMVHDTDIIELELKSKKFTLNLRKKEALQAEQPVIQYVSPPQGYAAPAQAPAAPAPAPAPAPATPSPAPAPVAPRPVKIDGIEITSPMAGTFYSAAAPGEAPFVKPGDRVKKGQVVGIIEAMKLMNEIEAEISGEVVKVLVDNGTPVTPGMPIILIRP